jgi:hypothetical protein
MATDGVGQPPPPQVLAEIREVVARAKAGDAAAVPRLREVLTEHPAIWRTYGDLAAHTQQAWLNLASGKDLHLRECVARFAENLRAELTRPAASPLERLLVERAVACWLMMHYHTAVEANAVEAREAPRLLEYRAKRQARAQRMFESALSALVTMQKLFPSVSAGALAPAVEEPAVALPAGNRPTEGRSEVTPGEMPNRVGAFFAGLLNGHRAAETAPAGATD